MTLSEPGPKIRSDLSFLLVDDHPVVCIGLSEIIRAFYPESTIATAQDYEAAVRLAQGGPFSLIITDLALDGLGGFELIQEIRGFDSAVPILVYTFLDEAQFGIRVMKAGATGFLRKSAAKAEIQEAISQSLRGERYFSHELAKGVVSYICNDSAAAPHESLSERELQVLRRLAQGDQAKEIAADLNLSAKTVSTYRSRIFMKLKFSSTADLVKYCLKENLA